MKLKYSKFSEKFTVKGQTVLFIGSLRGYSRAKVSLTVKSSEGDVAHSGVVALEDAYAGLTRNALLGTFCKPGNARVNDFVFRYYDRVSELKRQFTEFVVSELGP